MGRRLFSVEQQIQMYEPQNETSHISIRRSRKWQHNS